MVSASTDPTVWLVCQSAAMYAPRGLPSGASCEWTSTLGRNVIKRGRHHAVLPSPVTSDRNAVRRGRRQLECRRTKCSRYGPQYSSAT
jgi:hypothetical protein